VSNAGLQHNFVDSDRFQLSYALRLYFTCVNFISIGVNGKDLVIMNTFIRHKDRNRQQEKTDMCR